MNSPRFAPFFSVLLLVLPQTLEFHLGFAQGSIAAGSSVPRAQLPPTVQAALKSFENQFELTLAQDCPAERCFSRGCTYVSHETVDRARNASLPGLGEPEAAPGAAGPAQEYLTAARCEFAYENTLPAKDIATLVKRLEQKLARGYTTLSVEAKPLPALPATLRQTPAPPANSPEVNATPGVLATPDGLSQALATGQADMNPNWLRELWKALLPHVSWMIAILLGTTALLILIWAFRRLGRQSPEEVAEEKALLAALDEEGASGESSPKEPASEKPDADKESSDEEHAATEGAQDERRGLGSSQAGLDDAHAKLHRGPSSDAILKAYGTPGVWKARMQSEPGVFEGVVRRWLREKDFGSIAKLALGSQEEFRRVLPSGEEFALERAELAEFMAQLLPNHLPSDEEFAAILSSAIVASYVSDQGDDELVNLARLLREQFGPEGFSALVQTSSDRLGAVLFAIIPNWRQPETAQLLSTEKRIALVASLAERPRASHLEVTSALRLVQGAVNGEPAGEASKRDARTEGRGDVGFEHSEPASRVSHGRDLQAGQALSALLPLLPKEARRAFVRAEKERFHGAVPPWTDGLFYPEMLAALEPSARSGLFLRLEPRDTALWMLGLTPEFRKKLQADLPGALGTAVQSYLVGGLKSSASETRGARERVRLALAEAMRAEILGGRIPLDEAV